MPTGKRHIRQTIRLRLSGLRRAARARYNLFTFRFGTAIARISNIAYIVAAVASLGALIVLTLHFGFDTTPATDAKAKIAMRSFQAIFIFNVVLNLLFRFRKTIRDTRWLKWIVDIAMLSTLLPLLYPHPEHPWIPVLERILYSKAFIFSAMGAYSVVCLCSAVMKLVGRRTNPSLILSGSFLIFIILGSLALMMPKCTVTPISYTDSLFMATSAVCITGLSSIDIPTTLTPAGFLVMTILIQAGGLGIVTFTSFFAIFFSGTPSIYSQLLIKDMIYSKSINSLVPTLIYILGFTLVVEAIGAVAVYFTIPDALGLDLHDKLMFAGFHSMSAFCNAGFSILPDGMANHTLMTGNQTIYIVTSLMILAGSIGFPVLLNIKDKVVNFFRKFFPHRNTGTPKLIHLYDLNTKLVLVTTFSILAFSSVAFFILEYNNTLAGMSLYDKTVQSVFNSLTPRSAGFVSINPANFLPVTLLLVLLQMWIGGASQSLAGGIKVNTVAAVTLSLRAVVLGHKSATAFNRSISIGSVRRAYSVVTLSIIATVVYLVIVLLLEPQLSVKDVAFEVVSALFTVGSSLGITAEVSDASKIVLSTAMFLGRVGILSLIMGFAGMSVDKSSHYPSENIIIN